MWTRSVGQKGTPQSWNRYTFGTPAIDDQSPRAGRKVERPLLERGRHGGAWVGGQRGKAVEQADRLFDDPRRQPRCADDQRYAERLVAVGRARGRGTPRRGRRSAPPLSGRRGRAVRDDRPTWRSVLVLAQSVDHHQDQVRGRRRRRRGPFPATRQDENDSGGEGPGAGLHRGGRGSISGGARAYTSDRGAGGSATTAPV